MLTGKAKEDFEKWLRLELQKDELLRNILELEFFDTLPFSMQYGVYVDWFDSVGLNITVQPDAFTIGIFWYSILTDDLSSLGEPNVDYKTRTEAGRKAIEKATEIYNQ